MSAPTEADPAAIGPYTIVRRLGAGGMGTVHLGRDAAGRQAAIKLIKPELAEDAAFRRRFEAEAVNARRVASFCTAAVLGNGMYGDRPYLAIEYIEGPTLRTHVEREGALPPGPLHGLAVGVAAALTAIHAASLVHRDLKPSNVILSITGPRVIDFGIARSLDATVHLTASGIILGTPGWLPPEQLLRGTTAPAGDIFTWGCLVAYAGTGRHPYGTGDPVAMAGRVIHGEPDLDGLPAPLTEVVRTALGKDPARRPTARELLLTLTGGSADEEHLMATLASPLPDAIPPPQPRTTPPSPQTRTTTPPSPPSPRTRTTPPLPQTRTTAPSSSTSRPGRRLAMGALAFLVGLALLATGVLLLHR
ncbi:serine/threonine protein kinase [Actinoallomurus spadix]|uniref:non-specific serine/threonine protein kinase n=1 Tax=Actinoallomurus spadix TaxID=79912 RepID=A0ABN0VVZ3_9ACTN|nr:serine/threonine-protein kinase [Actinoallomurus spadix]MCO5985836.1 serine/threonine protein kinase [Actinoallomurus spadix]